VKVPLIDLTVGTVAAVFTGVGVAVFIGVGVTVGAAL
jgi:hypothetical protein